MILTRKCLPVDIFLTTYQNHSHFMSFRALILALEKKIILEEQQATMLNEQATHWLHCFSKQDWHSDVVRSGSVVI